MTIALIHEASEWIDEEPQVCSVIYHVLSTWDDEMKNAFEIAYRLKTSPENIL